MLFEESHLVAKFSTSIIVSHNVRTMDVISLTYTMTDVLPSVKFIKDHEIIQTIRMCLNDHEIALKLENREHRYVKVLY